MMTTVHHIHTFTHALTVTHYTYTRSLRLTYTPCQLAILSRIFIFGKYEQFIRYSTIMTLCAAVFFCVWVCRYFISVGLWCFCSFHVRSTTNMRTQLNTVEYFCPHSIFLLQLSTIHFLCAYRKIADHMRYYYDTYQIQCVLYMKSHRLNCEYWMNTYFFYRKKKTPPHWFNNMKSVTNDECSPHSMDKDDLTKTFNLTTILFIQSL